MTETPRHVPSRVEHRDARSGTLVGNGWLREARYIAPSWRDIRGKSALRKCMYIQVPPELRAFTAAAPAPPESAGPRPAPIVRAPEPITAHRRNPAKDVRMMPAYDGSWDPRRRSVNHAPEHAVAHGVGQVAFRHDSAPRSAARYERAGNGDTAAWWDDPIALGALLLLVPPMGLAALWTSRRYSGDARWALTLMTGLMMCLVAAVAAFAVR